MNRRQKKPVMRDIPKTPHKHRDKKPGLEPIQNPRERHRRSIKKLNRRLLEAAEKGNLNELKDFLGNGADINAKNRYGWTALMYATRFNHRETIKFLLLVGADTHIRNMDENTAEKIALAFGNVKIALMLRKCEKQIKRR